LMISATNTWGEGEVVGVVDGGRCGAKAGWKFVGAGAA
jgi:hypothetical protein